MDSAGNTGSSWNYGASATNEFSGFNANSDSPASHTWPGSFGVNDTAYASITLCPGVCVCVCDCVSLHLA
jgi:hypothetical protein